MIRSQAQAARSLRSGRAQGIAQSKGERAGTEMTLRDGRIGFRLKLVLIAAISATLALAMDTAARASLGPVVVSQVKDSDPGPGDGDPLQGGNGAEEAGGIDLGGVLIYDANDGFAGAVPRHGQELWRSDGTEAGHLSAQGHRPVRPARRPTRALPTIWLTEIERRGILHRPDRTSVERHRAMEDGRHRQPALSWSRTSIRRRSSRWRGRAELAERSATNSSSSRTRVAPTATNCGNPTVRPPAP